MTAQIRIALAADANAFPVVERSAGELFRSVPGLEWVADDVDTPHQEYEPHIRAGSTWVLVDGSAEIVGFISCESVGSEFHVWQLNVRANHQGKGLGKCLVRTACAGARARGLSALTLTTFRLVPWNEPFYRRLGFQTLPESTIGPRLAATLDAESQRGLPRERRCAMRLALGERSPC
jgi:ribosomal protein S18 acetylase RimI-like enzyme